MRETILNKILELEEEFLQELKNGSKEYATDHAKELHGEIRGLKWVLTLFEV